ncbi:MULTISPECIES: SMP-30/gluconolactonase/LRE family protein [Mameliella]|uniref:Gluconolaconase n=1 Tax=Mameliella alba TaxID=561184 RepID=A0A0B3RTN4_9RHOB|nr:MULTISPECIES: SMP-30/gluconolactonase/LRE family protein [Mameliella]KHQ50128.1 Gluconolaconase [Mameliella alba]
MNDLRLVADVKQELGESILWDDARNELVWVDIHKGAIWRLSLRTSKLRRHALPDRVGAIGLTRSGRYVVGLAGGFGFFDPENDTWIGSVDIESDKPATRLNDGRCDRYGNFICGGMRETDDTSVTSALYRFRPDGRVDTVLAPIGCANSTCFSPDGRVMYFSDMPTGKILAYDYDPDGAPGAHRIIADLSDQPGLADGSTVDAEGCIWNAQWGGGKLVRYTPDGQVEREIALPVTNPTCVGFGGEDLSTLFITSASFMLNEAQRASEPDAGSLFAVNVLVGGLPEPRFAD